MPEFPHMRDTRFPHLDNVDVYKYQNDFDYSRYDAMQMHLMLCTVPWDMGEAHIGNRTISGIGNVVWFETEAKRDAWFDAVPDSECYRFDTKYKALHRDNEIVVEVPFDVASTYNYLMVSYEPFAAQGDYVKFERPGGIDKWFWFIREVEFLAPNATRLHLMNDAFQTFMYRMHFSGMILERGHAPMFEIDADTYLANPLANNTGLLAEDVNYGREPSHVVYSGYHVFNEDCYAVIACTSSPTSNWGTKAEDTWHTPALASYTVDGVPSYRMFAMDVSALNTFLSNVESDFPQFKQTVKGVFFAPRELLALGSAFNFANTACHWVSTSKQTLDLLELDKSQFHYPARYAKLAKLYTSPYAHIEVTDENGQTEIIRIEDTTGELRIGAALSLAFPAISVQAHLFGYGGANNTAISFTNITDRSLTIGGKWYETIHKWDVPVFGIVQSAEKYNDYSEYFDRIQARKALDNTYASSIASANTAYDNTVANANTSRDNAFDAADAAYNNADRSAQTLVDNAALTTDANDALATAINDAAIGHGGTASSPGGTAGAQVVANNAQIAQANNFISSTTNAQIDATLQSASVSAQTGLLTSGANAVGDALSGNTIGAITGIVGGVINAGGAMASGHIAANLTATQAQASITQNDQKKLTSNTLTGTLASIQTSLETVNTKTKNDLIEGTNGNNATTQVANATENKNLVKGGGSYTGTAKRARDTAVSNAQALKTTDTANAGRVKDTATNAISNRLKQRSLMAPLEFGSFANTGQATTKPMALFANIVTQTKSAIAQAGDDFLRYGYFYNRQWEFDGNWNVGKYFTYWKLSDFWVVGLNIPDMYVDKLRFFLYGGVTVWRRPEDIGRHTIYENMEA